MPLIEFEVSLPSKLSTADLQKLKLVPYTDGELNVTKMVLEKWKWLKKIFFFFKDWYKSICCKKTSCC